VHQPSVKVDVNAIKILESSWTPKCRAGTVARMLHPHRTFADALTAVVMFLRAGYPADAPRTGYVPLLALAPSRDLRETHRDF
jgi:hypothetical protein